MSRRLLVAGALLLSACVPATTGHPASTSGTPTFEALSAQFDYDRSASLDLVAGDAGTFGDATARSLTFVSPKGGRASALLVAPLGPGPFPAVLMMPGSNQPPETFTPIALELAGHGAVVLIADQSQTRPGHTPLFAFTSAERDEFIQTVIDLRRAVDVLATRPNVDPQRVAFWGFSHGAFIGGILAGVERRVGSYVLQSGAGADYLRNNAPLRLRDPEALRAYLETVASIDPNVYIAHASPSAVFLQNGSLDHTYTAAGVAAWQNAASEPKKIATYDADHPLDAAARADAFAWLASRIGTR
jgi:dienelactone hydrolase